MDNTSSDDELGDWCKEEMAFAQKMSQSGNIVDQRLLDIFKLRLAERASAGKPETLE
eukprot:CAMPEP_0170471622 /NCGR_PEP_ID=MMETSP0123-20130129/13795_1 /TAXON_ID=182087 /ORGANISM="Favella ehrenbergii, Strain Fehren 1" /LENGTH=56 /DNA_ID=CAMNT_0010739361 /DNA_START=1152 /DNA_END=1322 /DNA_ORIENTATION=+